VPAEASRSPLSGVWLPVVTPFLGGEVDYESYERLIGHYLTQGIAGLIPLGTTGESPTVEPYEAEALIDLTVKVVDHRVPIYVGIGGNSTRKVVGMIRRLERYDFEGILSVCPYYNRPSEAGIREHFREVARSTDRSVVLYNIPYRTGVNLSNDSVLELSEAPNIVGIKDSCANLVQSIDLLRRRHTGFSVLTGEDTQLYTTLALGGDGGILASAHFQTAVFVQVFRQMMDNDHQGARAHWRTLEGAIRLFFTEANPMPIKYWLWRQGLIHSPECRLPLTQVSTSLAADLDRLPLAERYDDRIVDPRMVVHLAQG
jgi:4-hydroxy-tetrahydrodipicolinate synthase